MSRRLEDIPIVPQSGSEATGMTAAVQALLMELQERLKAYLEHGEEHVIDLRSLPLLPGERDALEDSLGVGEVSIRIDSLGPTDIHETTYPGIWWVIHRNSDDEVMTELIEVTRCPAIIQSQTDDMAAGLARFQTRLQDEAMTGDPV